MVSILLFQFLFMLIHNNLTKGDTDGADETKILAKKM